MVRLEFEYSFLWGALILPNWLFLGEGKISIRPSLVDRNSATLWRIILDLSDTH